MTSIVSICNLALSNLGKQNISDLSEATAEARACNQFYAHTRDTLLQGYPWSFAGKTASLGEIANDRPDEWEYAYQRPTDCLKVRHVQDEAGIFTGQNAAPYGIEGSRIYCNLSPALLHYTFRLTDPTQYSPLFIEALAWHLAVRLAMPLTRDPKIRADAFQLAMQTQGAAEMADANEERHNSDHESEFVTGRDSG